MADATWPATLPTYIDVNGYNESEPDNTVRQTMSVGPPKVRRRSTVKPRPIVGQITIDMAQFETLSTFYEDTLLSGVLTFDGLPHPRTRALVEWQFSGVIKYVPLGNNGTKFVATLPLTILP